MNKEDYEEIKRSRETAFTIIGSMAIGFVFGVAIFITFNIAKIESKERIEPELKVDIINGVADTTYIYRLPEIKD